MSNQKITIWVTLMIFIFSNGAFGNTGEDQVLVQFSEPLINGPGGPIASLTVLIPAVGTILQNNNVQTVVPVFEGRPKETVRNGYTVKLPNFDNYYLLTFASATNAGNAITELDSNANVYSLDSNSISFYPQSCQNPEDEFYESDQWFMGDGLYRSDFESAWEIVCDGQYSGNYTKIGIFDFHIMNIPGELSCENGWPLSSLEPGHGTQVFGVIAGATNTHLMSGAGRNVIGHSYRCFQITMTDFEGMMDDALGVDGCSLLCTSVGIAAGDGGYDPTEEFSHFMFKQFVRAYSEGKPFVAASGNESFSDRVAYPAGYGRFVVGVGNHDGSGIRYGTSNYGPHLDLLAPGVSIPVYDVAGVTDPQNVGKLNDIGTSFAQPLVTSTMSLMKNVNPLLEVEDLEGVIKAYCSQPPSGGGTEQYGSGLLDAGRAVQNLGGVYELHTGNFAGASPKGVEGVTFKFFDLETGEMSLKTATKRKHWVTVTWPTAFVDSVGAWGKVGGTNGYEPETEYYHNGGVTKWVTSVPYCTPISIDNNGGTFETYTYVFSDGSAPLGPTDPSEIQIRYGVIGKVREKAVLLSPNGGEIIPNDQHVNILWDTGEPTPGLFIDYVDLYFDKGDGGPETVIATGVDATLESFVWVPTIADLTSTGSVRIVFHHVGSSTTGEDLSDATFSVEFTPSYHYSPPTNPQAETGLTYSGTPYSSVAYEMGDGGKIDLFISISDDDSKLYQGNDISLDGIPEFEEWPSGQFVGGSPQAGLRGVSTADFDSSGTVALFAAHATDSRLYKFKNDTVYNVATAVGLDSVDDAIMGTWQDYNDDDFLDLFISRAESYVEHPPSFTSPKAGDGSLLLTNTAGGSEGRTLATTPNSGLPNDMGSISSTWLDYDEDGDPDLFIGALWNSKIFENDAGVFSDQTSTVFQGHQINKVVSCALDDLDKEHGMDLVIACHDDNSMVFFSSGNGKFGNENGDPGPFLFGPSHGFSGLMVYDYNRDGFMDILGLPNDSSRAPQLFENIRYASSPTFVEVPSGIGLDDVGYVHGGVAEDFGGEGGGYDWNIDLYLGRPVASNAFYLKAEQSDPSATIPNFVGVSLDGGQGYLNQTGIGAVIEVEAGSLTQTKRIDGGSMRGSQASRNLTFGLGDYSGPVTATITWPDGFIQSDVPLVINQTNVISNASVQVLDSTVEATYALNSSGLVDWEFTWETDSPSDPSLDAVHFDFSSISTLCRPGYSVITQATSADVTLSYTALAAGGYSHVLTWKNRSCIPRCVLPFQVESGWTGDTDLSDGTHNLRVRICTGL